MRQQSQLEERVQRWAEAGLIDAHAGERILAFENEREQHASRRWPVLLALIFGGILVAAGLTLFVAAHWDEISPSARFSLMILMVAVFHVGGAFAMDRFPALSRTLHTLGTITLGAAIFLTAQIFNLHENWATGVLLWTIGAAAGYALLKDWIQAALVALLAPAWLISQWSITTERFSGGELPLAVGLVLTAICYVSACASDEKSNMRRSLVWIGAIGLLPCVGTALGISMDASREWVTLRPALPISDLAIGWTVALLAPLFLAWILRRREAWVAAAWGLWAFALVEASKHVYHNAKTDYSRSLGVTLILYALLAIGSVGLVTWGLHDKRKERVNFGVLGFAVSVIFFYFDSFMGKIGRSASLLILGLICLAGGYALEMTRRKLAARVEAGR